MGGRVASPLLAFAALLGAAPALAQTRAATPQLDPHSLVVARWLFNRPVETPPCPEPAICAGQIVEARLVAVETLAGPAVPARLTVRLHTARYGQPEDGYRAILIVRPDGRGRPWAGRQLGSPLPGRDSCIRSDWFTRFAMRPPRRARRRGEQTCFRVR
jgi:hypothetical protein